jgi:hypothetical protein
MPDCPSDWCGPSLISCRALLLSGCGPALHPWRSGVAVVCVFVAYLFLVLVSQGQGHSAAGYEVFRSGVRRWGGGGGGVTSMASQLVRVGAAGCAALGGPTHPVGRPWWRPTASLEDAEPLREGFPVCAVSFGRVGCGYVQLV